MCKRPTRLLRLPLLVAAAYALLGASPAGAVAPIGMVCTNGTGGPGVANFSLRATSGTIETPDGNSIYMWSYANQGGSFQVPSPVLCVNQGDTVSVTLSNPAVGGLPEPTSIVFPGQRNVLANGLLSQPVLSGPTPSLADSAPVGGSVTYSFVASDPGTYLYESGTDPTKQVEMGLYGALVVRPKTSDVPGGVGGHAYAYDDTRTEYDPSREYLLIFHELDPVLHHAVETGGGYDAYSFHPRYFTVTGRAFPDTIQNNGVPWLPTQPYGALVRVKPKDSARNPLPALVRMVNAGLLNHPFHPHGFHVQEIAQDGRLFLTPSGGDASTEHFGDVVPAGASQDSLFTYVDEDKFCSTGTATSSGSCTAAGYTNPSVTRTGSTSNGSNVINGISPSTTGLTAGAMAITGSGIPADAFVTSVNSPTQITISAPATATANGVTLTFVDHKPIPPLVIPSYRDLIFKDNVTWFSGSPYLGIKGTLPNVVVSYNNCGEFYFPWHSHALNEFVNYDEGFGGLATLLRVDPLPGCTAFPSSTKINTGGGLLKGGSNLNLTSLEGTPGYYQVSSVMTTLRAAITTTASPTTVLVNSASGFPSSGTFSIQIDNETMTVTGGQGTTTWTVTRGPIAGRTTHAIGSAVSMIPALTDWYAGLSGVTAGAANLRVTYQGRNCGPTSTTTTCASVPAPIPTTLFVWNWRTSAWVQIGSPQSIGSADAAFTDVAVPQSPAGKWTDFVGTGASAGQVRVRVLTERTSPSVGAGPAFHTWGNFVKLTYDAP